jgi:hypothetical protein
VDHNPFLKRSREPRPATPAKGGIEAPGQSVNLAWQTRAAAPTDYEKRLGDALERVFGEGALSLAEVVAGLNAIPFPAPTGKAWDEASFAAEIKRLGA